MSQSYRAFLKSKQRIHTGRSIDVSALPAVLFDWQAAITKWALKKGRAAVFADCGLGKTFMQLSWAASVPGRVLILAPLCVAEQTVAEGVKLGVPVQYSKTPIDAPITITNYERLDAFDPSDYAGVVLDESSILKAFDGKTRQKLIETFQDTTYRLCCTATPSPNDIAELANHAEFLGLMTRAEFLATWFVHDDEGWRMKGHAVQPFYRWLASWALAVNTPSDIGYSDEGFDLPPLNIHDHILQSETAHGTLFPELSVTGIGGRLSARRASIDDRVAEVSALANESSDSWLIWCGLNDESDAIAAAVPDAVNVEGSDSYDDKRKAVEGFIAGDVRVLVSKPKILGFGMNFQHCHQMAFVGLSDSYEAYYQCLRRCWRFGQRYAVDAHIVVSEAESIVVENVRRKQAAARELSQSLIAHMRDFEREELIA
jgi:superfamily II DNA or RNA helicase